MKLAEYNSPTVYWHKTYEELPDLPLIMIGHEFLDALPIHQFEYHENQWLERFVDIDPKTKELCVRLSKKQTPAADILLTENKLQVHTSYPKLENIDPIRIFNPQASEKLINNKPIKEGMIIEASPDVCSFMQQIALLLDKVGGSALFIDYGHNHINYQTIRAIYNHKFVDILQTPGNCDLSGDIDFSSITRSINLLPIEKVKAYGPIPQGYFLCGMGIEQRVKMLLEQIKDENEQKTLMNASQRIVLKEHMGQIYKAYALSTTGLPSGFEGGEQFWNDIDQ